MNISDLHLIPPILRAAAEIGYETPSPIQQKAIPPVLAGRDLLGCAQTGTGKTAAFAMPILQRLHENPAPGTAHSDVRQGGARPENTFMDGATRSTDSIRPGGALPKSACSGGGTRPGGAGRPIRALILTPTRELALQIDESFADYGRHLPLAHCVIFGGVSQNPQVEQLKKGVDILTATPGRLNDLIGQGYIDLGRIEIFVLDEADRMLDMGFVHDVKRVIAHLPQKKQTLLFSATMPREIEELADSLLHSPEKVMVTPPATTVESIEQSVYFVDKGNKRHLLAKLLQDPDVTSALVFTRTKHGADRVVRELARAGIGAMAIHGNKSQNARQNALGSFKDGRIRVLVATDIAARGIDVTGLSHVFNYDLPNIPETYVHRIGRTGRAGRAGVAISFCDFEEQEYLADIEKLTHIHIPPVEHEWPMQIFEKPEKQAPQARAQARPARTQAQQAADIRQVRRPEAQTPQAAGKQQALQTGIQAQPAAGAQQTRRTKTRAQQNALQTHGAPQGNAAPPLQKGDRPMEQKNNAPHRQADGSPAAGAPAEDASAAGAAQADPGKKRRRRGGRRHKNGAQTAAAQAAAQQQAQTAQQPEQSRAAKEPTHAGQSHPAKGAPGTEQDRGAAQTSARQPQAGQKRSAQGAPDNGKNRAAAQAPAQRRAGQPRLQKAESNEPDAHGQKNGREQTQNGTPRAETPRTETAAERDDSLQVISRRTPAQKYASFEDYIKAHG